MFEPVLPQSLFFEFLISEEGENLFHLVVALKLKRSLSSKRFLSRCSLAFGEMTNAVTTWSDGAYRVAKNGGVCFHSICVMSFFLSGSHEGRRGIQGAECG